MMLDKIKADITLLNRFWDKVNKTGPEDCWEWMASYRGGYGHIVTSRKTGRASIIASRLSYYLEYGIWPGDLFVCHKCDNTKCVNPKHLFLGTALDNSNDKITKGRARCGNQKGEANGSSKLTEKDVILIKNYINRGKNNCEIARIFEVHHATISLIRLGKSWTHIN